MLPTREEAIELVCDGLSCNPGHWEKHCLTAAHCAEKIASACGDMDSDKAFIPGLLHDIGQKIWSETFRTCFRWLYIHEIVRI